MNITCNKIDKLNAVLTIKVDKNDYETRVTNVLVDYRKKHVSTVSGRVRYPWPHQ
jgi:trigger factor